MKLMRNTPERGGKCKYALIRLDLLGITDTEAAELTPERLAMMILQKGDPKKLIEFGEPNSENEFFVIKLKDINADIALNGYAGAARTFGGDSELSKDVEALAARAGHNSPWCKRPD